jgi:hypothetical protein
MKQFLLKTDLPRNFIALAVLLSSTPLQAQNTMAGSGSGASNHDYCPPGVNCDPCDTARNGSLTIRQPGSGSTSSDRTIDPPTKVETEAAGARSTSSHQGSGPRLKLVPVPTWSALGGSPAKVSYCVAVNVQNVGNAPWVAPLKLKLEDIRSGLESALENPSNPGTFMIGNPITVVPYTKQNLPPKTPPATTSSGAAPGGRQIGSSSLPDSAATADASGPPTGTPHVPLNSSQITVAGPISAGSTLSVQLLAPCVTIDWYRRPELIVTSEGTKLSCPVTFGPPSPKRLAPSGTVQRPAGANGAISRQ